MNPSVTTDVATPISSYSDLITALDARRRAIGLNHEEFSERAGLPDRYTSKITSRMRGLGALSFPLMTGALGVELVAYPVDPDEHQPQEQQ